VEVYHGYGAAQAKLAASSMLPVPLYFATRYGHTAAAVHFAIRD